MSPLNLFVLCFLLTSSFGNSQRKYYIQSETDIQWKIGVIHKGKLPINLPYEYATSRSSDGRSSTDAGTSTSAGFADYKGRIADSSHRYKNFILYQNSCREQGISPAGAGDNDREEAKAYILNQPGYQDFPAPETNFTVFASAKYNPSHFCIQTGETYTILVPTLPYSHPKFNKQMWNDGGTKTNAYGYVSKYDAGTGEIIAMGRARGQLRRKKRMESAPWMSLLCSIGMYNRALTAIKPGDEITASYLPLFDPVVEATQFYVGKTLTFKAQSDGQLICFANDNHNLYWNNFGSLFVTVKRESWPPLPGLYYERQKLPTCSSAIVFYHNLGDNDKPGAIPCNNDTDANTVGWKKADLESTNNEGVYPEFLYNDITLEERNQ